MSHIRVWFWEVEYCWNQRIQTTTAGCMRALLNTVNWEQSGAGEMWEWLQLTPTCSVLLPGLVRFLTTLLMCLEASLPIAEACLVFQTGILHSCPHGSGSPPTNQGKPGGQGEPGTE